VRELPINRLGFGSAMRLTRYSAVALVAVVALLASHTAGGQPPIHADAYVVQSALDGEVLAQHAASERRSIASITKLMTVLVALDHLRLDEIVVVPDEAAQIGESTIYLWPGDRISVRDLIRGALVPSANDAATVLALHVSGSLPAFAALMNAKARWLGMRDTRFANPHGLDQQGHYSTARDVVKLARAAFRNPVIRQTSRLRSVVIDGITFESTDDLAARLPQLIGGKTGHTSLAGWSEVAAAQERGVAVYAAVLGASSRESRDSGLEALLRWGLGEYVPIAAVSAERVYAEAETAYGRPAVQLVAPRTIVRAARLDRSLIERVVAPSRVALPVRKGQRLGEVKVFDGTRLVASSALVAASDVSTPGPFGKLGWYAGRTVHHLVGFVT
jgi:D-alanyl-D-alanine carboxypeptidase (penicillin-binding protein 5/6)